MLNAESKMRKKLFIVLPTLLLCAHAYAQEDYVSDDAGKTTGAVWAEVGATKVLPYNLSLSLDAGLRTGEWFNEVSRVDVGVGLAWKPSKHWKLGVGYTFLFKHYPTETAHKSLTEYEWKYRAAGASDNTDFTSFMGAPTYSAADGTAYTYRGYNEEVKDYTRVTTAYWRPRHRINVDAAYTLKLWRTLRFTLRERYQLGLVPAKSVERTRTGTKTTTKYRDASYDASGNLVDEDGTVVSDPTLAEYDEVEGPTVSDAGEETTKEKTSKTLHTLRSRLTLEIDRKGWALTPYAYAELFNDLAGRFAIDKVRASAGVEWSVSPRHRLQLGYVFNHENDDDGDQNIHAISVGYKFKF